MQLEKQEHGKEERETDQATGVSEVCTSYHIPAITALIPTAVLVRANPLHVEQPNTCIPR
jgi:hypothetical protein